MSVLLIGYGKIGKKIYKDYEKIITDIYDPNVKEYNVLIKKKYKLVIVCVPDENIMHIINDANIETDYYLIKSTINITGVPINVKAHIIIGIIKYKFFLITFSNKSL